MNLRAYFLLALLMILADWLASLASGQEPVRPAASSRGPLVAPQQLPNGAELRARPIGDILTPGPARKPSPKVVENANWNAPSGAPSGVALTSGTQTPPATGTAPAAGGSISQRLQAIRRSVANEYSGKESPQPSAASTAAPSAAPSAAPTSAPAPSAADVRSAQELRPAGSPQFEPQPAPAVPAAAVPAVTEPAPAFVPAANSAPPVASPLRVEPARSGMAGRESSRRANPVESTPRAAPAAESLLSSLGPQLRVETTGPRAIVLGKPTEYVVHVANGPGAPAEGIDIVIDLPSGIELASANSSQGGVSPAKTEQGANYLKWNIPRLEAGGQAQLNLSFIATAPQPLDLRVEWACQSQVATARLEVLEPKLELAIAGPREVLYGEKKTYIVTISNPGSGDLEHVVVTLPGGNAERPLGLLRAGERREVQVDVVPRGAGPMTMAVEAAGGTLRTKAEQEVIVRRAVLETSLAGPQFSYAGAEGVYRATVANTGDAPAENVQALFNLPSGMKLVSATEGGQEAQQGRITWNLGRLAPAASRVMEVKCMLAGEGESRVEVVATAAGDMTASQVAVTRVETIADLKLAINDPQGPIRVGDEVRYEIRITNRGTKSAQQVRVLAFFSNGVEPISSEGGVGRIQPGQVQFDPIANIAPGQELVLKVAARAQAGGDHRFRAEVECGTPSTQLAAEDTTRYYVPENGSPASSGGPAAVIGTRPVPAPGGELRR